MPNANDAFHPLMTVNGIGVMVTFSRTWKAEGGAADAEEPQKIIAKPGGQQQRNQKGEGATAGIARSFLLFPSVKER